ncbi:MAG: PfkB family carbohydrate kinase [Candidatus Bathyarchaeota archaeon]|nr:PfkB family carbohydrate kinase [Candidatus Bathyarchaeota archaeon]
MFDLAVVGHLAIDSIMLPSRQTPFVVLGGSATYVSLVARRLDASVAAISKVGRDFPDAYRWWLEQERIDLSGVSKQDDAQTTRFELEYNKDLTQRVLRLKSRSPPITVDDLPPNLRARIIHVAPIAGEITYENVEVLKKRAEVLSLDPQGLVRSFSENGTVDVAALPDKRILSLIDIYKSSLNEVLAVTGMPDMEAAVKAIHDRGASIVIVTLGAEGAAISVENAIHRVPAYKPEKLIDPTGAGDTFIGAFLAEYSRGEDCSWCSYVGSAAASLATEGIGPTFPIDKDEIYRRTRLLYEKEIKP